MLISHTFSTCCCDLRFYGLTLHPADASDVHEMWRMLIISELTDLKHQFSYMKVVLFDTEQSYQNLLPLSYTRPVGAFRVGIVTIREKWEHFLPGEYSFYPKGYLRDK